jgi:hypothetical protein
MYSFCRFQTSKNPDQTEPNRNRSGKKPNRHRFGPKVAKTGPDRTIPRRNPLIIERAHFALRKLAIISETVSKIDYQSKTQATSTQVLISMRLEDEDCILKSRDIYNVKQSIRRNTLKSLTLIQFLLQNLKRDN